MAMLIELKLALINAVKQSQQKHGFSQNDLAMRIKSNPSCATKIEAADPSG